MVLIPPRQFDLIISQVAGSCCGAGWIIRTWDERPTEFRILVAARSGDSAVRGCQMKRDRIRGGCAGCDFADCNFRSPAIVFLLRPERSGGAYVEIAVRAGRGRKVDGASRADIEAIVVANDAIDQAGRKRVI